MRVILFNLYPYRALRESRKKRRLIAELAVGSLLGLGVCYAIGTEFEAILTKLYVVVVVGETLTVDVPPVNVVVKLLVPSVQVTIASAVPVKVKSVALPEQIAVVPEMVAVGKAITVTVAVTPVNGVVIVPSETSTKV